MSKTQKTRELVEITVLGLDKTQNLKKSFFYQKIPHNFYETRFYLEAPALTILSFLELVGLCCRQLNDKIVIDLSKWNHIFRRSRRQNVRQLLSTLEQYQLVRVNFFEFFEPKRERKEREIERDSEIKDRKNVNFLFEKYGNGSRKEDLT